MTCRLCLTDSELCESHIIPEWCYGAVYDDKHRLHEYSTAPGHVPNWHRQKGVKESLLCRKCEQRLSRHEKYVRELVLGTMQLDAGQNDYCAWLKGLNYADIKLFQLSILWRAGVTSDKFFAGVELGEHADVLRQMILTDSPGAATEYPCIISATMTRIPKVDVIDGLVLAPERVSHFGFFAYRFIFAGFAWLFLLTRDASSYCFPQLILSEAGDLTVPKVAVEDTALFRGLAANLSRSNLPSDR